MRVNFLWIVPLASSLILGAGCANNPPKTDTTSQKTNPQPETALPKAASPKAEAIAACVWPNTTQPAPGWTCDEQIEGVEFSAFGIN